MSSGGCCPSCSEEFLSSPCRYSWRHGWLVGSGGLMGGEAGKSWRRAQDGDIEYTNNDPREQDLLNPKLRMRPANQANPRERKGFPTGEGGYFFWIPFFNLPEFIHVPSRYSWAKSRGVNFHCMRAPASIDIRCGSRFLTNGNSSYPAR